MPNYSEDPDAFGPTVPDDDPSLAPLSPAQLRGIAQQKPQNPQQIANMLQNARMEQVLNEMDDEASAAYEEAAAQMELMNEARMRFAKSALYEQILAGRIFEGDDPVTLEVEAEFREFAQEQMMVLLGISPDRKKPQSQLTEEEVGVLKLFATKMLGGKVGVPAPGPVAPKTKPAALAPPRPVIQPVAPAPSLAARRRGRPPGTGKNQRAVAMMALQKQQMAMQAQQQVHAPTGLPAMQPNVLPPMAPPQADQTAMLLPNGQVAPPNTSKAVVRPTGRGPRPAPMPSPEEMVAKAMMDGETAAQIGATKLKSEGATALPQMQ